MNKTSLVVLALLASLFFIAGSLSKLQHYNTYLQYILFACGLICAAVLVGYAFWGKKKKESI